MGRRTPVAINSSFLFFCEVSNPNKKSPENDFRALKDLSVPGAGLEPARPQWSLDFKSNVSTNSTIRA
jgi:hypothetical protein